MLYEQKPAGQEETSATSGPDEAVRAGGVMEHLIHDTGSFQDAAVDFSIITSLQTFQILQRCTNTAQKQPF